jgi:hypothetical protein
MVTVDADTFESVGYVSLHRTLCIKFRNPPVVISFQNVPGFRHEGLMAAPRKDAYFKTFIQNRFIEKPVELPPPAPTSI